ncbi:hypothetical protein C8R46DRAFT_1050693 [Mycena filopes]|nr:hypothetical protein C8R46DRAFT_1050693 [Mycena filopes]
MTSACKMTTVLTPSIPAFCMVMPLAVLVPVASSHVCVCVAHTAPAPPAQKPAKADKADKADPAAPAPTRTPSGAGLPAPLIALLRTADGPFLANEVFSTAPTQALAPVEENVPAPEWYAITCGRFVGVVDQYALSDLAISGVGSAARKAYTTQGLALDAFNRALTWGGIDATAAMLCQG